MQAKKIEEQRSQTVMLGSKIFTVNNRSMQATVPIDLSENSRDA